MKVARTVLRGGCGGNPMSLPDDIFTLTGVKTAYVLFFIHLESRRVFCSSPSYSPDSAWVTQQARNMLMWCDDEGISPEFLIRDADTKFTASFNEVWQSEGARVIQIPPKSPQANAFAESWIASFKRECLEFFICVSRRQLDYICRRWVYHHNTDRPHQGVDIGNNVLQVNFKPTQTGDVRCREDLGGIIRSYYREAA
ncbi:integrase [Magnetococcus marinus MC-1]|uniref:Integrase n=2 Tax=Magnetococcus marinus (strain ATCC BAA-1437 / JCM 17883 / MC-1) TaxID=156889 RepID=A0L7D5_MAGMM|nr:integrase [Magnetococcus marinus MC-1]